jgi:hypothetical protein
MIPGDVIAVRAFLMVSVEQYAALSISLTREVE